MATDSLFRIIKALSTGEKIHFKRSINKKTGDKTPAYLVLFDIIDGMEVYDKAIIKKKLITKKIKVNYNETKSYLENLLIEFIESYNAENGWFLKVTRLIRISLIMKDKGLYEEAWTYLNKAKEIAETYQVPQILLIIQHQEIGLIWDGQEKDRFMLIEKKQAEKNDTINTIQITNQYLDINNLILLLFDEEASSRDKEILSQADNLYKRINDIPETTLVFSRFIKHYSIVLLSNLTHNYKELKNHSKYAIDLCRQNPEMIKRLNTGYSDMLEMYLISLHFFHEYSNYNTILKWHTEFLQHMQEFKKLYPTLFTEIVLLDILITKGEIELAFKTIQKTHRLAFTPHSNVNILVRQYKLILQHAYVWFLYGNYNEANKCIQDILNKFNTATKTNMSIYYSAKMMRLLITYERKDYALLNDLIQSTQKYFLRHQKLYELEVILFNLFRNLLKNEANALIWEDAKKKIELYDSYFLHEYFGFDILAWLESKIQKRSIADLLKEKAKQCYPEIFEVKLPYSL